MADYVKRIKTDAGTLQIDYEALANLPSIPSKLSEMSGDSSHRVVSDAEKTKWNTASTNASNYASEVSARKNNASKLLYIDASGNLSYVTLGSGLTLSNGVLSVTSSGGDSGSEDVACTNITSSASSIALEYGE